MIEMFAIAGAMIANFDTRLSAHDTSTLESGLVPALVDSGADDKSIPESCSLSAFVDACRE